MSYYANPRDFIHPEDSKALQALKSIPGFEQFAKAYMKIFDERSWKIVNMSSKVRLSEQQCPRIYNLLVPICEKLGIPVPELYLELDRMPNAYTSGDTTVFITVTSGLLELLTDEEIQAVLAHECGHIVCRHVLYHNMGEMIINGTVNLLGLGPLVSTALSVAFYYWMRCSEFSADRASAVVCGGSERVVDVMLRLAGGTTDVASEINKELFMQQAAEYSQYVDGSGWNKVLEAIALMHASHPFTAVRAATIHQWCNESAYKEIHARMHMLKAEGVCPKCGAAVNPGWAFCRKCGTPVK
ncbi:MAG: M48 family metalloprotease [Clostridia bacterium]|nr:M48 family metalloprotease [Clostridia bacterium]